MARWSVSLTNLLRGGRAAALKIIMSSFPNTGTATATPLETVRVRTFAGGLNTLNDPVEVGEAEMSDCQNIDLFEGRVQKRQGTQLVGASLGTATGILGMNTYRKSDGTTKHVAFYNTSGYYNNSGTWTAFKTGLTANKDMATETFLDRLYCGNDTDALFYWDGSSNTNVAGAPTTNMLAVYRNRLVTNDVNYPYRFRYTNIGTDTFGANNYVDVRTGSEMDKITGLTVVNDRLLIFKENSVHMWDETQLASIGQGIGVAGPRSIVNLGDEVVFWGKDNAYITTGSRIVPIGDKISPSIQSLNRTQFDEVAGGFYKDKVYFAVPEAGESTNTVIYTYSIPLKSWWKYTGLHASCFTVHDDTLFFGDTSVGKIWQMHYGLNDDAGGTDTAIDAWFEKEFDLQRFERFKKIKKFFVNVESSGSYTMYFKYEYDQGGFTTTSLDLTPKSTESFPYTFPLTLAGREILGRIVRPQGKGHILRLRLGDADASQTFIVYDLSIHYKTKTSIK